MATRTHCDECGRGICGEETICRRCVDALKSKITELENELSGLSSERDRLVEEVDSLEAALTKLEKEE